MPAVQSITARAVSPEGLSRIEWASINPCVFFST